MQFFLFDLALASAALLGYRALGTVIASRGPLPREPELPRTSAPSGPTQQVCGGCRSIGS